MQEDTGASSGPGYSAEPEPCSTVSALSGEYPSRGQIIQFAGELFGTFLRVIEERNDLPPSDRRAAVESFMAALRFVSVCDSDGSPEGRDAQRLDGEAATARAGTASPENSIPDQE